VGGFLANIWIVLHRLVATPGNPLPDCSELPLLTALVSLAIASISGGVSEEVGFRGDFQGELERCGLRPFATLVAALVMSPEDAHPRLRLGTGSSSTARYCLSSMAWTKLVATSSGTSSCGGASADDSRA